MYIDTFRPYVVLRSKAYWFYGTSFHYQVSLYIFVLYRAGDVSVRNMPLDVEFNVICLN